MEEKLTVGRIEGSRAGNEDVSTVDEEEKLIVGSRTYPEAGVEEGAGSITEMVAGISVSWGVGVAGAQAETANISIRKTAKDFVISASSFPTITVLSAILFQLKLAGQLSFRFMDCTPALLAEVGYAICANAIAPKTPERLPSAGGTMYSLMFAATADD
jgi:hypothetical protein